MSCWILAIDVGTTSTAAARRVGDRVEMVQLQNGPRMPSMVYWREGTGQTGRLVLGNEAEELSTMAPWCLERTPKSRLGEEFIQLGDKQLRPVEIIAAILREVYNEAISLSGGEAPGEIRLTHPARWQKSRLDKLEQAAKLAGLPDPVFVPEPVAAAVHFASERLQDGEHVAVYDLGGGTLDTAVLKRTGKTFEVVGRTGGDEELGGEDFDDLLYRHLGDQLGGETWDKLRTADERQDRTWAQANRELLRQARRAKEGLSRNPEYEFYLGPPVDQELSATVSDFEGLISPTLRGTVAELERTILAAGLKTDDMKAIYLAGGSSRIPLVGRLIQERLGISPEHLDDPKAVIAMGAARLDTEAAKASGITKAPLTASDAPIPPLPGAAAAGAAAAGAAAGAAAASSGGDTPPPPPSGADETVAASGDPNATQIASRGSGSGSGGGGGNEPPPPAPPPPPEPAPRQPAQPLGAGGGGKKGGNRGKILAGVAAAVVVLGGVAAAITLSGGDSGGGTTDTSAGTDTVGTDSTDLTDTTDVVDTTDIGDDQGNTDALALAVKPKVRATCVDEKEKFFEEGAIAGLTCTGRNDSTVIVEQFPDNKTALQVFKDRDGGVPQGGPCREKWNTQSTWTNPDGSVTKGKIACYDTTEDTGQVVWTAPEHRALGFVIGKDLSNIELINAWSFAAN